jgi:hypothetical protein
MALGSFSINASFYPKPVSGKFGWLDVKNNQPTNLKKCLWEWGNECCQILIVQGGVNDRVVDMEGKIGVKCARPRKLFWRGRRRKKWGTKGGRCFHR